MVNVTIEWNKDRKRRTFMYIPAAFREDDTTTLHALMREFSFATLVTVGEDGAPFATHLPFLLDTDRGTLGTLRTHLARPNPQWKLWVDQDIPAAEALVLFQGAHAYISPSWYEVHPSVPTWNYAVVHAYGAPRLLSNEELRQALEDLVKLYEAGNPTPWEMNSLSEEYVEKMMRGIVGVEIEITRLEGKFKMSQNRTPPDQRSAIRGLRATGDPLSGLTADLMESLTQRKDEKL